MLSVRVLRHRSALGVLLSVVSLVTLACNSQAQAPAAPSDTGGGAAAQPPATSGAPVAPPPSQPAIPKVNRVVFAVDTIGTESNEVGGLTGGSSIQLRPMYEDLIGVDIKTGKAVPQLATEWKLEPDGQSWRFQLRKGVKFHNDKGELTSADVEQSRQERFRSEYPTSTRPYFENEISIEVVGDHEFIIRTPKPDGILMVRISEQTHNLRVVSSKDAETWDPKSSGPIAGTGPYQFKEREFGSSITYQRVPYKHWRVTPDFPEFEFRIIKEASSRLAALLTGEVHLTTLPDDLLDQAVAKGMNEVGGNAPGLRTFLSMYGAYIKDRKNPEAGYLYPESPMMDLRVRKALSKAIDRDEINKALFRGKAEIMMLPHQHPTQPGWNPDWLKQFKGEYGYDPNAAKALLAEAGYSASNPLKVGVVLVPARGYSGSEDMLEAIATQWRKVGIEPELLSIEGALWTGMTRKLEADNHVAAVGTSSDIWTGVQNYGTTIGAEGRGVELLEVDKVLKTISTTVDPEKQDKLYREAGDLMFAGHNAIPLFYLPVRAVVHPEFVASYEFAGFMTGSWTHVENIKATR